MRRRSLVSHPDRLCYSSNDTKLTLDETMQSSLIAQRLVLTAWFISLERSVTG